VRKLGVIRSISMASTYTLYLYLAAIAYENSEG
jgi:hypothetical protein